MRSAMRLWMGLPLLAALACGGDTDAPDPAAAEAVAEAPSEALAKIGPGPHDVAILDMGELGTVRIELLPEIAPETVENFVKLANEGFYDGTYFHRVIPGFMIQGGDRNTKNEDPRDDGKGNPGYRIGDEFSDYPHTRGTVAMANSGRAGSAGSQFFIIHQDSRHLDGAYTAFGRVVAGIETVDAVTELEIDKFGRYGPEDRPYPVSATVVKATIEPADATETAARQPPSGEAPEAL